MGTFNLHINIFDVFLIGVTAVGLTFGLLLWFNVGVNRAANRFLSLALFVGVLWLVWVLVTDMGIAGYFSWLPLRFSLVLGPLIYFYVLKLTRPEYRFGNRDWLHFSPLLLEQGLLVVKQAEPVLFVAACISVSVYLHFSLRLIERFYGTQKFNVWSDRYRIELRWLSRLLWGFRVLWLLFIPAAAIYFYDDHGSGSAAFYALYFFIAIIFVRIGIIAYSGRELEVKEKLFSVRPLVPAELKDKGLWLKNRVRVDAYFEDPELSLVSLAEKLGLSTHELSRIINVVLKKSFNDFINEYRIGEVIRKIQKPEFDHLTLLGIAYDSGFNSKTTFNRAFRQVTGMSAVEFKKELKKERPSYNLNPNSFSAGIILHHGKANLWSSPKLNLNTMFKNYFKIAWRSLVRNRASSFINIGGLAVGMAASIIIGLWIYDEVSFNEYHQNYAHIGRLMRHETWHGETGTGTSQTMPMGYTLRSSYGNYFKYVVMSTWTENHVLSLGDKKFTQQGNFMQAEGPEMLTLKMISGSRSGLKDLNSVLLNASTAKKLFGDQDALNQVLKIDTLNVKVAGVYEDIPANSEFKDMSFVAPWDLLVASNVWLQKHQNDWNNQFLQILVQINPNTTFEGVSEKIRDITLHHVSGDVAAAKPRMFIHPMSQWHLYSKFTNGVNVRSDALKYVWFYGIIGLFVLLLACINFMNLSTARSEKRAKEVGMRKVMGSVRYQLIAQFYCETILVAGVSFLLALGLVRLSLPWFNDVAAKDMGIPWGNPVFWLAGVVFILITGFLAGSYPALYLSSFNSIKALKGTFVIGRFAALPRKALVVLQYTISIALIIGTLVVYRQIQFTKDRPVGYTRDGLLALQMISPDYQGKFEVLRNELKNTGAVTEVAASVSPVTGLWRTNDGFSWQGKDPKMKENFGTLTITPAYGKTIGWQVVAGRDFKEGAISDSTGVVVNEAAVKYMGLSDNPIGQFVHWDKKGKIFQILGVVKDMVMDSPFKPAYPTLFFLQGNASWLFIRINPQMSASDASSKIEAVFKKIVPSAPFEYKFVDDDYANKFAAEVRISKLAGAFSGLAILISCIGLFGMATFIAEQRIKEIGLRKVLGASVFSLWRLLSQDFLILVIISIVIATPIAWYFMHGWLQNYEYRISLSWWIFAVGGLSAMLITLITVSFQSIRTALASPVKSLRSE